MRSAACICRRSVSSFTSSPASGASFSSSATAWRRKSSSLRAASSAASASASAAAARRRAVHASRSGARSIPAKASSSARWPRGFSRPRSSCWPCSSTRLSDSARSTSPDTRRSLTQPVLRPSAALTRRRIRSSSTSIPASASTARAGWPGGRSNTAVTSPCAAPARTSSARPRQPRTKPRQSSRIDLPAPVSPVSTFSPGAKSSDSRSISSMSRMSIARSMSDAPDRQGRARRRAAYSHLPWMTCR